MNGEIKWLKKLDAAMSLGRNATASLNHAAMVQHEAGNQVLSAHLYRIAEALEESLRNADSAVSEMISEEVKASQRRLDETFVALLKSTLVAATEPQP